MQPNKNWFSRHMILGYVFLALVGVGIVSAVYYLEKPKQSDINDSFVVIAPPPSPITTENLYVSTKYGFQVQLEPGWTADEREANFIFFRSPEYQPCPDRCVPAPYKFVNFESYLPDKPTTKPNSQKTFNGVVFDQYLRAGNETLYVTTKNNIVYMFSTTDPGSVAVLEQLLSTFRFTDNNSQSLVEVIYAGGLCMPGQFCSSVYKIGADGTLIANGEKQTSLTQSELTTLKNQIIATDYNAIKSRKFTGTCPVAYDGQEVTYTFYLSNGTTQVLPSCTYEIDEENGVFKTIQDILSKVR
jgi:hypothetical protein